MEPESLSLFRIFNIGLVFQNANLISSLSAIENIMFPIQLTGRLFKDCYSRALELLTLVGLKDRAEHLPFQLSAGEQQRVAIARALANSPPIIIADEPTANLDNKNAAYIARLFEGLRKAGKTIIVATHESNLIEQAHRILEMDDGKIINDTVVHPLDFQVTERTEDDILNEFLFGINPEEVREENLDQE
jgi:ABC-type lipoprotein export system ATPase subunit